MPTLEYAKNTERRERKYVRLLSGEVRRAVARGFDETARIDAIELVRHARVLQLATYHIETLRAARRRLCGT